MPDLFVVQELRAFLVDEGVGQRSTEPPSMLLPSIWTDRVAPLPRKDEGGTITLLDTRLSGPPNLDAWLQETFVDVIVRHRSPGTCRLIHRSIFGLLHPRGDHRGRCQWTMNDLPVEYSTLWRGEQPLPFPDDGDTDVVSRVTSFRICCRRASLAGVPYVPGP